MVLTTGLYCIYMGNCDDLIFAFFAIIYTPKYIQYQKFLSGIVCYKKNFNRKSN